MSVEDYKNIQHAEEPLDTSKFTECETVDGVTVCSTVELAPEEAQAYVNHGRQLWTNLKNIFVEIDGDDAVLYYNVNVPQENFERIRRITGYLVGTLDRFNDAKAAEERERVKHKI